MGARRSGRRVQVEQGSVGSRDVTGGRAWRDAQDVKEAI